MLAPQRGLTAILTTKTSTQDMYFLNYKSLHDSLANFEKGPTEFSKCSSPPAQPGVYLNEIIEDIKAECLAGIEGGEEGLEIRRLIL